MIEIGTGSILAAKVDALANPVNCVGAMGKGLALAVKQRWPETYAEYKIACDHRQLRPGGILITWQTKPAIIHVATKDHWRSPSQLEWIRLGVAALRAAVLTHGFRSLAIPALGCGNGGLSWAVVKPLIEEAFITMPTDVRVLLYEPL